MLVGNTRAALDALFRANMTKRSALNGLSCLSSIVVARLSCYAPVLLRVTGSADEKVTCCAFTRRNKPLPRSAREWRETSTVPRALQPFVVTVKTRREKLHALARNLFLEGKGLSKGVDAAAEKARTTLAAMSRRTSRATGSWIPLRLISIRMPSTRFQWLRAWWNAKRAWHLPHGTCGTMLRGRHIDCSLMGTSSG